MTNDDRSNEDRTGDGQEPRYGERVDPAPASTPQYGEHAPQADAPRWGEQAQQYQAPQGETPQYGSTQYAEQQGQYGQPQHGQPQYGQQPYAAAPASAGAPSWQGYEEPKAKKKTVGVVAFVVAVAALVVGIIGGALFGGVFGGSEAFRQSVENNGATPSESDIMALTTSSSAVTGSLLFYLGSALGLWAIVQGIVAAVTKRGRGWGVFAIILAVVAAIAFVVAILVSAVSASGMS
ncbi:hypothetical protein Q7F20_12210 [Curtobacterium sp. A7_M15]|uniref:hypothetical protein n=1 Tax=Curtobacterium sp. A7_M15 TaxID=3065241 RepID=UPI002737AF1A|nr:hypothetical protein [Curtobacterium sp. A7_M15]MDP4334133.1 hypothetical protein [Curtobacterium sp. A7_M15]